MSRKGKIAPDKQILIAYVDHGVQIVQAFTIEAQETIGQFLQRTKVRSQLPEAIRNRDYGVFSQPAGPNTQLVEGDRLEFYQPLKQKYRRLSTSKAPPQAQQLPST